MGNAVNVYSTLQARQTLFAGSLSFAVSDREDYKKQQQKKKKSLEFYVWYRLLRTKRRGGKERKKFRRC